MRYIKPFLTITLAVSFIALVVNSTLANYMTIILALIISLGLAYFLVKKKLRRQEEIFSGSSLEIFPIILVILLIIFLTGGIGSPIFFLIYFLPFGIAFLFEPVMVFVFLIAVVSLFTQQYYEQNLLNYWLQFSMLFAVTIISFFFGKEFKRREKLEQEIQQSTSTIVQQAQDIKKEIRIKDPQTLEKVDELIKETKNLQKASEQEH